MIVPNLLLIAGTGIKSGKTTIACMIIEEFSELKITAIKITPHFHETTPGLKSVYEETGISIYEETDRGSTKDTSRMLRSGASKVYFAKVLDDRLLYTFNRIRDLVPEAAKRQRGHLYFSSLISEISFPSLAFILSRSCFIPATAWINCFSGKTGSGNSLLI
jgi:hypothetical protein